MIIPNAIWIESVFILFLILIMGYFAGSEIAVVSSRQARIKKLVQDGRRGAKIVEHWLKEPEVFLSTVQIFITLLSAMASAVGGAIAIEYLKPRLERIPALADWAHSLALFIVVMPITYCSLLGELVPKSLALHFKERMAVRIAVPIHWLSKAARPVVILLAASTRTLLRLIGMKDMPKEMFASEDEIRFLIQEGGTQGIFDQTEQQMIPKVFDFANLQIKDVMVPREQIFAIELSISREELLTKVSEEGFTRVPVFHGTLDKIVGILHIKDLIYIFSLGGAIILQDLVRSAVFVLETTLAKDLLKLFQRQHIHIALVQDSKKRVVGLVTLENLIERIVGDIEDEHDPSEQAKP